MKKLMKNGKFAVSSGIAALVVVVAFLVGLPRLTKAATAVEFGTLNAFTNLASHAGITLQVGEATAVPGLLFSADLTASQPITVSATSAGSVTINNKDGTKAGDLVANVDSIITYIPANRIPGDTAPPQ
jgi:hypothetical protein